MPVSRGRRGVLAIPQRLALGAARDRPVFIGGCPRSGTTLLGTMVHSHPELAIPPETRFVVESYKRRAEFGDLREQDNRRRVGEWIVRTKATRFKAMQLDRRAVVDRVRQAPPTIGSLSGAVLAEFAAANGKSRWGDKRPKYVEYLRLLLRLYPDAQFIHLIRDARGCTASLKRLGWWGWGAPEALDQWRRSIEAGIKARAYCRADQYLELRYEDLVADPVQQLERLCDFMGVPYRSEMLSHHLTGAQLIHKPYHARVSEPVNTSAVDTWRNDLELTELALVEREVGPLLDEFGYPRLTGLPAVPEQLDARYRSFRGTKSAKMQRSRRADRTQRRAYDQPVAARLTSGQKRMHSLLRFTGRA